MPEAPQSDLFGFAPAVPPAPTSFAGGAEISACGQYRWMLTRVWGGGPLVCFIGLNPSTADALRNDPTVWRWVHFANAWGFGGFVAVNLYPFRAANPDACKRWAEGMDNGDPEVRDKLLRNVDVIEQHARAAEMAVACWGTSTWDDRWPDLVVNLLCNPGPGQRGIPLHCFGITAGGSPKHPMARGLHRVPNDQQPLLWRKAA